MPDFNYTGLTVDGAVVKGQYYCNDAQELDQWLGEKNIELIDFHQSSRWILRRRNVDVESFILFTSQLSQLLSAGVPLLECLRDLADSQENRAFALILDQLFTRVESGQALSLALETTPVSVPQLAVPMIRVGEQSGNLAESLAELCKAIKWQQKLAERWKKAIFYPLFSGSILLLVCIFLMTYLVPSLVSFIKSTSYALPWYTNLLIASSEHIKTQGLYYLFAIVGFILIYKVAYRLSATVRLLASRGLLKLCWIGPVLFRIKIARFTYFSGVLYQAGVPVIAAFESSRDIMDSLQLEKQMDAIIESITSGDSVGQSFRVAGVFPPFISRMLLTGEKTGRLDHSLSLISEYYQDDAEKAISRMEEMIGPFLILFVGVFLIWIIIAVIGPIYDVVLSVGQSA